MSLFARLGLSPAVFWPNWHNIPKFSIDPLRSESQLEMENRHERESKESESGNRKINPQVDTRKGRL